MTKGIILRRKIESELGVTLWLVAFGLIALLGVMALAIDLGLLYVARNEAQRAADSAALAGADVFYTSACTDLTGSNACDSQAVRTTAAQDAMLAAAQNYVAGQAASVNCPEYADPSLGSTSCPDIEFSDPTANGTEPQISVTVRRTGIHTIFAQVFGAGLQSVSATATAEAYNPNGGNTLTSVSCVSPFLVPNCNPTTSTSGTINSLCGYPADYFMVPNSTSLNPGVIGEQWDLHTGDATASDAAVPSEWFTDAVTPSQGSGGSALENAIQECQPLTCGEGVPAVPGKKVGPVDQGLQSRIGLSPDTIVVNPNGDNIPPYQIYAGASNPLVQAGVIRVGAPIDPSQSPSVATLAVYDGAICGVGTLPNGQVPTTTNSDCLSSGQNANSISTMPKTTVNGQPVYGQVVIGWMQVFIQQASGDAVPTIILNTSYCGGGTTPPVGTQGATPIPIRLITGPDANYGS